MGRAATSIRARTPQPLTSSRLDLGGEERAGHEKLNVVEVQAAVVTYTGSFNRRGHRHEDMDALLTVDDYRVWKMWVEMQQRMCSKNWPRS